MKKLIIILEVLVVLILIVFISWKHLGDKGLDLYKPKVITEPISIIIDIDNPVYLSQLLDILERYKSKTTLFLTAETVREISPIIKKRLMKLINEKLIEIGQRTDLKISMKKLEPSVIKYRILQGKNSLKKELGVEVKYLQPPLDEITDSIIDIATKENQQIIMWDKLAKYKEDEGLFVNLKNNEIIKVDDNKKNFRYLGKLLESINDDTSMGLVFLDGLSFTPLVLDFSKITGENWEKYENKDDLLTYKFNTEAGYLEIDYQGADDDWAGIYQKLPVVNRDWRGTSQLVVEVFGNNTGQTFNFAIADEGNERWYVDFVDNWEGCQDFSIPYAAFRLSDGYGGDFIDDRKLGLGYVREFHILPIDGPSHLLIKKIKVQ